MEPSSRIPPAPPRERLAGSVRGERTRDEAEQAELERLTGQRFMPSAADAEMDASLGDEAT